MVEINAVEVYRRLDALERMEAATEKRLASLETGQVLNTERYTNIERRLDRMDGHISWLLRIAVAAVVSAFVGWLLSGGLVIAGGP